MRIVAFHSRSDDVKLSSTLWGGISDVLRFEQSS